MQFNNQPATAIISIFGAQRQEPTFFLRYAIRACIACIIVLSVLIVGACSNKENRSALPHQKNKEIIVHTTVGDVHLTWNGAFKQWETKYRLPGWRGYHCVNSGPDLADGEAYLAIDIQGPAGPPSEAQITALKRLLDQPDSESRNVTEAIYRLYPKIRADYGKSTDPDIAITSVPIIHSPDDMRRLISLRYASILHAAKNSAPYIALELATSWDPEHGIQVLMNGARIVSVGTDALNPNNITNDGGTN